MSVRIYTVRLESNSFNCDNLRVTILKGVERISQPFVFNIDVVCLDSAGIDVPDVSGSSVTLLFLENDELVRRVHGMIEAVDDRLETEGSYRNYRFRVVPLLRRLALVETLDIFIAMSTPEIVKKKLGLVGLEDAIDDRLLDTYPKREFVVQYKETDLNFVSRLLEHLGISYVFRHDDTQNRTVFVDSLGMFPELEREVFYRGRGERAEVYRIESHSELIPSGYVVHDYNYRTPSQDLVGVHQSAHGFAGGVVEFGNHTKNATEANNLAQVRAQEREAQQLVYNGESGVMALTAGSRFNLSDHPHIDEELLLVAVNHHLVQPGTTGGDSTDAADAAQPGYHNSFEAIPAQRMYRPPRVTHCPRISGVVTGIIDRPPGSNKRFPLIDEQGRYTVRFLFDTAEPGERRASHQVRLAQLSAGSHYGTHFPLRPGVEVIIVFVDGDPDRPIIAGAMPNPEYTSPVTGPESMNSRIKTESGIIIELTDA